MLKSQSEFLREIKNLGNPQRAIADQRYHKSNRVHWGVSMPQCHQWAKSLTKEVQKEDLIAMAEILWMSNIFDPMMCAAKILSLSCVKPSPMIWKTIKSFLKNVDGWALEDVLANAAWKCILADQKLLDDVEKWTTHSNFWMRRAALVYTLPFAKAGQDPERMLKWASSYVTDSEWFIQKAIGWWLRVLGEHNPTRVILFLNMHWPQLKTVAKREATRKLSLEFKQQIEILT